MEYEQMTARQRELLRIVFGDVELDSTAKTGFLHSHWPGWKEENTYMWTLQDHGPMRPITWRESFGQLSLRAVIVTRI
jgi:hypothetical protein